MKDPDRNSRERFAKSSNESVVGLSASGSVGVGADVRYIGYRPNSGPSGAVLKLRLNPVIYSLGLRWRL